MQSISNHFTASQLNLDLGFDLAIPDPSISPLVILNGFTGMFRVIIMLQTPFLIKLQFNDDLTLSSPPSVTMKNS